MTNEIRIGRAQAERWLEEIGDSKYVMPETARRRDELRALLADPVVERQEPVAWMRVYPFGKQTTSETWLRDKWYKCTYPEVIPLYAEHPAPVAVLPDLTELREYHAKAISNLKSYADDEGLRDSDVKHYTKRADFHAAMVVLIDKVKELNQ